MLRRVAAASEDASPAAPPRTFRFGALLAAALLALPAPTRAADEGKRNFEPGILEAVEAIREGFRTMRADPLLPYLPENGKVFLAVKIITEDPSLYSRDQTEALLRQAFATLQTVQFHINMDRTKDTSEAGRFVLCPAVWSFVRRGARAEVRLRFVLLHREDRWLLSEIRETR